MEQVINRDTVATAFNEMMVGNFTAEGVEQFDEDLLTLLWLVFCRGYISGVDSTAVCAQDEPSLPVPDFPDYEDSVREWPRRW